jgi:hypothetical protein
MIIPGPKENSHHFFSACKSPLNLASVTITTDYKSIELLYTAQYTPLPKLIKGI